MNMKITTKEIDNMNIGLYKNARCTKASDIMKLYTYLHDLQSYEKTKETIMTLRAIDDEEAQKKYKQNNVIGATISGVFGESRCKNQIIETNNIMCVDVDEADNKELFKQYGVEEIKRRIFEEFDFVYAVCLSCRGKGFFFIVPIPDVKYINELYTGMYYKLKSYGITIDKHCKDISRLRFISYDPNILIKRDCQIKVFDYIDETQINEIKRQQTLRIINKINKKTRNDEINYLAKTVDWLISIHYDCGEHWCDWAPIGSYFKTLGEEGRQLFLKLSSNMSGFKGEDDFEKSWKRFRTLSNENEALGKFYTMVKNIYGPDWRKEINMSDTIKFDEDKISKLS